MEVQKVKEPVQIKPIIGDEVVNRNDLQYRIGVVAKRTSTSALVKYSNIGERRISLANLEVVHPVHKLLDMTLHQAALKLESQGSHNIYGETTDGRFIDCMTERSSVKVTTYGVESREVAYIESLNKIGGYRLALGKSTDIDQGHLFIETNDRRHARQLHVIAVRIAQAKGNAPALWAVKNAAQKRGIEVYSNVLEIA